ncbi:hypothetical protein FOCC_FOCC008376 [Frankliniella occidentalis]|nr:hypothetical protein FOCC_FOCC008376 [Frankliniella occidentalis]
MLRRHQSRVRAGLPALLAEQLCAGDQGRVRRALEGVLRVGGPQRRWQLHLRQAHHRLGQRALAAGPGRSGALQTRQRRPPPHCRGQRYAFETAAGFATPNGAWLWARTRRNTPMMSCSCSKKGGGVTEW